MRLRAGYLALAFDLQEAAGDLSSNEMRDRLQNAITAAHKASGQHPMYVDHTGDEQSGDVIFACDPDGDGDTDYVSAPYSKGTDDSDDDFDIDTEHGRQVQMRHSWETVPDDQDHYAAMQEANLYTGKSAPLCERFVSKKERDSASSGSFAGKGKSFPILKAADVKAAASSLGRAGVGNYSTDVIKRNIIRIAKEKGWESELPKAWQDGGADDGQKSESAKPASGGLKLVESCAFPVELQLREALLPGKMIKLIAPGKGSSAYYTEEVLRKAAADKIFHAGVPMRIDHPTMAEESARPEGSVKDWGAVLESDAVYRDDLPTGKGLYAPIKKFSDHAQTIDEKGPYAGVSIRANGNAVTESGRPVMREGVPLLKEFTSAEGADMVTRAGAGGMFLTEAAKPATQGGDGMSEAEAKKLIEAAVKPFQARLLRDEARAEAGRLLESVALPQAAKTKIIERAVVTLPETADGALDIAKFRESVVSEAKAEGEYIAAITGGGRIIGMGVPAPEQLKPEHVAAREAEAKRDYEYAVQTFIDMGLPRNVAEISARGRAA